MLRRTCAQLFDMDFILLCVCVSGGFDHVRVHPKFLHSNATSHKWALGGILLIPYCNLRL